MCSKKFIVKRIKGAMEKRGKKRDYREQVEKMKGVIIIAEVIERKK